MQRPEQAAADAPAEPAAQPPGKRQQTFDEIRRKYQRDADFRAAVDRYVADFEKLLADVTKNGREWAAGSAYLSSDTGKVYTMLAHAAGRFD